jgi:hypothetical protein
MSCTRIRYHVNICYRSKHQIHNGSTASESKNSPLLPLPSSAKRFLYTIHTLRSNLIRLPNANRRSNRGCACVSEPGHFVESTSIIYLAFPPISHTEMALETHNTFWCSLIKLHHIALTPLMSFHILTPTYIAPAQWGMCRGFLFQLSAFSMHSCTQLPTGHRC